MAREGARRAVASAREVVSLMKGQSVALWGAGGVVGLANPKHRLRLPCHAGPRNGWTHNKTKHKLKEAVIHLHSSPSSFSSSSPCSSSSCSEEEEGDEVFYSVRE